MNVAFRLSTLLGHAGHHGDAERSGPGGLLHALTHADHLLALAAAAVALVVAQRVYRLVRSRRERAPLSAAPAGRMR